MCRCRGCLKFTSHPPALVQSKNLPIASWKRGRGMGTTPAFLFPAIPFEDNCASRSATADSSLLASLLRRNDKRSRSFLLRFRCPRRNDKIAIPASLYLRTANDERLTTNDQRRVRRLTPGTLVLVPNPVPTCAKPLIFGLSHFENCSYSEKAQRFLSTTLV